MWVYNLADFGHEWVKTEIFMACCKKLYKVASLLLTLDVFARAEVVDRNHLSQRQLVRVHGKVSGITFEVHCNKDVLSNEVQSRFLFSLRYCDFCECKQIEVVWGCVRIVWDCDHSMSCRLYRWYLGDISHCKKIELSVRSSS